MFLYENDLCGLYMLKKAEGPHIVRKTLAWLEREVASNRQTKFSSLKFRLYGHVDVGSYDFV
jgi:hypothetical protein